MHQRRLVPVIALLTLAAGCASTANGAQSATTTPTTAPKGTSTTDAPTSSPTASTAVAASKGWIGGEPDWSGGDAGGGMATESATADGAFPEAPVPVMDAGTSGGTTAATTATPIDGDPVAVGEAAGQPDAVAPLRAGSVDDNADFTAFVDYLARIKGLGITTRPFDPTGRIVVTVTGTTGLPVAGAAVTVSSGGAPVATVRTTADGTARFLPMLYGDEIADSYDFAVGAATGEAAPGGAVALTSDAPGGATSPVAVDVLFLLDATGSMGDEIDRLKTTIDSVAGRIAGLDGHPDVRFGMTLYRDLADTFVTTSFDFTSDVGAFRSAIDDVTAAGGSDYPEAMDEGLADAMSAPSWRDPATTVQLVFLVADAPPHVERDVQTPYTASIVDAISRGITIIPIASSESDDQAEAVFRQLAEATGGRFVFLSYGAGGAATGTNTDIDSTDYEELSLDDLIVRFVGEQLAALEGTSVGEPPADTTVPPPPTNPPGQ